MNRRQKINGTAPSSGALAFSKIQKLIAFHQDRANVLRSALDLLIEAAGESAQRRGASTLQAAMELDAARRGEPPSKPQRRTGEHKALIAEQRTRTAARLDAMSTTAPSTFSGPGTASLVRAGYIRRAKGGGYVRTGKPYRIDKTEPPAAPPPAPRAAGKSKHEQRAGSGALLEQFDTTTPRPIPAGAASRIGPLVRRGYLRAKGAGYIRTRKPFDVAAV